MWELIQSNKRKSAFLIVALAAVLALLGYAIGFTFAPNGGGIIGVLGALGVWAVMMLASVAGGERILMATAGAREVTHDDAPQLFNIVEEMKIAAGLPAMPRVFIMDNPVPNAFAVGLKPERAAVAVTTGLLGRLNRDELQGVVAHELGHIRNRDTLFMTLAGVTVGAVVILADLYLRGMLWGGGRGRGSSNDNKGAAAIMLIVALLLALLAPLLAQLLYFACSRRREYLADASAAQFTRYPLGLAAALEKIAGAQTPQLQVSRAVAPMFIVNPLAAAGSATSLFSTHPPTADRIKVLRGMAGGSLAAYAQSFAAAHNGAMVIGARTLAAEPADATPLRAPAAAPAPSPAAGVPPAPPPLPAAKQWRAAQDILHKVNNYGVIPCPCGIKFKIPPDFKQDRFYCPRCGAEHVVPPEMRAGGRPA